MDLRCLVDPVVSRRCKRKSPYLLSSACETISVGKRLKGKKSRERELQGAARIQASPSSAYKRAYVFCGRVRGQLRVNVAVRKKHQCFCDAKIAFWEGSFRKSLGSSRLCREERLLQCLQFVFSLEKILLCEITSEMCHRSLHLFECSWPFSLAFKKCAEIALAEQVPLRIAAVK